MYKVRVIIYDISQSNKYDTMINTNYYYYHKHYTNNYYNCNNNTTEGI